MGVNRVMSNIEKIEELKKIDYNLSVYIRKHIEILVQYGNSEEEAAKIIVDKISNIINKI